MSGNRLNIVSVQGSENQQQPKRTNSKIALKLEAQAFFERQWLENPSQFDPLANCMDRERLERSHALLTTFVDPAGKRAADLGCGSGVFARRLRDDGAIVHAVDVASQALKELKQHDTRNIETFQDYVPMTLLADNAYDIVAALDLVGYLNPSEYRLFFAELSRLVNKDGYVVCSTPVDFNSEDALQRFGALAETEFVIGKWVFSHHSLYIRVCDFFAAPARFVKGSSDGSYRDKELKRRYGFNRWWFKLNSHRIPALLWKVFAPIGTVIEAQLKQSPAVMNQLERVCRLISSDSGISHAIFIGKRRPLVEAPPEGAAPQEMKHKKQLWE